MDVYSPEARAEMADRIRLVATVGRIVLASIVELSMSYSMLHDRIRMAVLLNLIPLAVRECQPGGRSPCQHYVACDSAVIFHSYTGLPAEQLGWDG